MVDNHVTIPLMVRSENGQFIEEDLETLSENELSTELSNNPSEAVESHIYQEISSSNKSPKVDYLEIPKLSRSRSTESSGGESSGTVSPMLDRKISNTRKISSHEYEKLSTTSISSKKSNPIQRKESKIFRRITNAGFEKRESKSDDEENVLEVLRQIVRKCTTVDPFKRPSSKDVLDLMYDMDDKS